MTKLSVNINKLATLRNSRGKNNPDIVQWAKTISSYGAHGITVHPRPDSRHIRKQDVYDLAQVLEVEFNIEGYPDEDFLYLVQTVKPTQCTLVPDSPNVLTSNAGWRVEDNFALLQSTVAKLQDCGIRTALFLDPFDLKISTVELLQQIGTDRVELYTEAYAQAAQIDGYGKKYNAALPVYQQAATILQQHGIGLNAGHDLNLDNLSDFLSAIPYIEEVSIGHALICDALNLGMQHTIEQYLKLTARVCS